MPPLSVLDLSPVTTGGSGPTSLKNTLDLARLADALGDLRYWVAEHHNLPSIASSAPEIMIGQIAAVTANIRVGAGGVMLPNHAPLRAERFKTLSVISGPSILASDAPERSDYVDRAAASAGYSRDDDFLERFRNCALEQGSFRRVIRFGKSAPCRRTYRYRRSFCRLERAAARSWRPRSELAFVHASLRETMRLLR